MRAQPPGRACWARCTCGTSVLSSSQAQAACGGLGRTSPWSLRCTPSAARASCASVRARAQALSPAVQKKVTDAHEKDVQVAKARMLELQDQLDHLWKLLEAMNLPYISKAGFEADDVIGTLAKEGEAEGLDVGAFRGFCLAAAAGVGESGGVFGFSVGANYRPGGCSGAVEDR